MRCFRALTGSHSVSALGLFREGSSIFEPASNGQTVLHCDVLLVVVFPPFDWLALCSAQGLIQVGSRTGAKPGGVAEHDAAWFVCCSVSAL